MSKSVDLASDPNTDPETLKELYEKSNKSFYQSSFVRTYEDFLITYHISKHHNTPISVFEKIADDFSVSMKHNLLNNPSVPDYLKKYIKVKAFIRATF